MGTRYTGRGVYLTFKNTNKIPILKGFIGVSIGVLTWEIIIKT